MEAFASMMETPSGAATPGRSRRPRHPAYIAAAVVVAGLVVVGAVALAIRYQRRQEFASGRLHDVCASLRYGQRFQPILTCRVTGSRIHLVGGVDVDLYTLLSTGTGEFCLGVDYRNTAAGRQYISTVREVDADGCDGLTGTERSRLRHDVRARGGIDPGVWTLDYGDG